MTPYPIDLQNIPLANTIVFGVLMVLFLVTLRKSTKKESLIPIDDTQEIKGFAMLAIVAIHIGYSLANNWEYLHPLSSFGGIGVDLFLFLSGYGLTVSMMRNSLSPIEFYKKRLLRVFIPFWIAITLLFVMDWSILGVTYSWQTLWQSFLVYFPRADIWGDFNSPLWYMTWLTFFYILFPLVWVKNRPWITTFILIIMGLLVTKYDPLQMQTNWLHGLHLFAFPLGILIASHATRGARYLELWSNFREKYHTQMISLIFYIALFALGYIIWRTDSTKIAQDLSWLSHIGDGRLIVEQVKSLVLAGFVILFFSWKPWKSQFLSVFGLFSYEIYLLHWPLMARYDIFFHHLPAWLATLIWLGVLVLIGWGMQKVISKTTSH